MRIRTKELMPGDIMATGEVVLRATKFGMFRDVKMHVTLQNPKTGKTRLASWSYWGTIGISILGVREKTLL